MIAPIETCADFAVQTDWSGGDGTLGPVLEWGNEFYLSSSIDWSSYPGSLRLLNGAILEYNVDVDFDRAYSVYSEDIDGDGDMDVLGAADLDNDITWWENIDGTGTSWIEHIVDGDFLLAHSVYSEDINGDGYMDILGAGGNSITWWENIDGTGTSWSKLTIDGSFDYAYSVYSEDLNGDGFMDILGAGGNSITWWENIDGSGTSWTKHNVNISSYSTRFVHSADINGDGYMDILGAVGNTIIWWENTDGQGMSWIERAVCNYDYGAYSVYSEDINGTGFMDVLGVGGNSITWCENIGGSGTSWFEHTVDGDISARYVYSEDINGDGFMDILSAAYGTDEITWWDNYHGAGIVWDENIVDKDFDGAYSVYSEDINGDGYMDILGAAYLDGDITWWDLNPPGWMESTIFNTQGDPEWDYLDWNSQIPPGTSISFQVRASDDHTSMGTWSEILILPCPLDDILTDGDRYLQYRAILETSNPDSTPTLNDVTITWNPLDIEGDEPVALQLLVFAPNPVAGSPVIRFSIPESVSVELRVFDISGRMVFEIHGDGYSSGYHDVQVEELSPGIYFCKMSSGDFTSIQRFVVIQ